MLSAVTVMRVRNTVRTTAARCVEQHGRFVWAPEPPRPHYTCATAALRNGHRLGLEPQDGWLGVSSCALLYGCFVARIGGPRRPVLKK